MFFTGIWAFLLTGLQHGRLWGEEVRSGFAEDDDCHLSVGFDLVSGGVGGASGGCGTAYVGVADGSSGEEEIALNPVALAIDVGIDTVRPLGLSARVGDADVVGSGTDPDLATVVEGGLLPDADVVTFGEGVEGLLEDEIGRAAVDDELGDGSAAVVGVPEGGLHGVEGRGDAEGVGLIPASLLEGSDELLPGADEHDVGDIGRFVVGSLGAQGSVDDESFKLWVDGDERPSGPGVFGLQHGGTDDLDLEIGSGGKEDFATDGEAVDSGDATDGVAGDGIDGAHKR